jgi:transcriptional antiterminator
LHVHSASESTTVGQLVKLAGLMNEIVETIEARSGVAIPRDSTDYIRLITHLRGVLERLLEGKSVMNPFSAAIREQYPKEFGLAEEVAVRMREQLGKEVSQDEEGYLAMHLHRLFQLLAEPKTP